MAGHRHQGAGSPNVDVNGVEDVELAGTRDLDAGCRQGEPLVADLLAGRGAQSQLPWNFTFFIVAPPSAILNRTLVNVPFTSRDDLLLSVT